MEPSASFYILFENAVMSTEGQWLIIKDRQNAEVLAVFNRDRCSYAMLLGQGTATGGKP